MWRQLYFTIYITDAPTHQTILKTRCHREVEQCSNIEVEIITDAPTHQTILKTRCHREVEQCSNIEVE
jgi:hypothetical protein